VRGVYVNAVDVRTWLTDRVASERVTSSRKRRRPTRSGVVLSADLIIDTALGLIDSHGAEALTARRLGQALGADPSAVYRYFRGTDELLLALYDRLIGETLDGFTPGSDWVAALRELGTRVYRCHLRHPRLAALSAARVTRRENEFRAVEAGVGLLRRAGFDDGAALRLYLAFIDTVLGFAALDAATVTLPPEDRAGDESAWTSVYARLPPETYPNIAAARDHLATVPASSFPAAMDLVLAALAAQAPR
jgi:AcrR family transcriptional regulator